MSRLLLAPFCLLLCVAAAHADLDPETDTPYQLNVVLDVEPHPMLTEVFLQQIRRELHDWLQADLGKLATVTVATEHPLLKEVDAKGLQQALDSKLQPLPGWEPISGVKTHFVLIRYTHGRYELQARQHDGSTGLASPVVRSAHTYDRQFVTRTAARLIDLDFGIVGTLDPGDKGAPEGHDVHVTFKGAGLGVPLERWVKKGDVFAVAQLMKSSAGLRSYRVPWALVEVVEEPKNGVSLCRLFQRYQDPPRSGPSFPGRRCLKLGTTEAPIQIRFVNEKTFAPIRSLRVALSPHGYDAQAKDDLVTNDDGVVQTDASRPYQNLAFARVLNGDIVLARMPVEVLGDQTLVCPIAPSEKSRTLADIDLRKKRWLEQLLDSLAVGGQQFKELSELVKNKAHEEALKKAQASLQELKNDIHSKEEELAAWLHDAEEAKVKERFKLTRREEQLQEELQGRVARLEKLIGDLETVIKEKNDPNREKWRSMVAQAQILEDQADIAQALALYDQVLKEMPENQRGQIPKHADDLRKQWDLPGMTAEQREARAFIYSTWSKASTVKDLKDNLDKARASFETSKKAGDQWAVRKFVMANVPHAAILKKKIDEIKSQDDPEKREEIKGISELSESLEKLYVDAGNAQQAAK